MDWRFDFRKRQKISIKKKYKQIYESWINNEMKMTIYAIQTHAGRRPPMMMMMMRERFAGTGINITTEGCKHLGAALDPRSYLPQYVGGKVEDWVGEVTKLAEFARSQIGRASCRERV